MRIVTGRGSRKMTLAEVGPNNRQACAEATKGWLKMGHIARK